MARRIFRAVTTALLSISTVLVAETAQPPLPATLSLDDALALAGAEDPSLQRVIAQRSLAYAQLQAARAETGISVGVEGHARWVSPPDDSDVNDDISVGLVARKPLFDFGRSSTLRSAADAVVQAREITYRDTLRQKRITIMERFFDVLLADLTFVRDDEDMAVEFVALDRLRNRHALGQISDIDLAEQQQIYERARRKRTQSSTNQRATRAKLAIILNRPGQLPSTLLPPHLPQLERNLPDYDVLLARARADNLELRALQAELAAVQERLKAARAGRSQIDVEVGAYNHSRELGSSDTLRAGINFSIPLYTGGAVEADVAEEQARIYEVQAQLREREAAIAVELLERWQELNNLRIQQEEALAQLDFRELYLDRSRANYEMEVKADLGDAMVQLSTVELYKARTDYRMAVVWEEIDYLTGHETYQPETGEHDGR